MIAFPYKALAIAVVVLAVLGLVAWSGFETGKTFKQGEWDAAVVAEKKGKEAALQAAADAIAKIEVKSETIVQPLRTEIRTNTVYADCRHTPSGLRYLNDLIESTGGSKLPAAKPAK